VVRVRDGAQGQGLGQEGDVVPLDVSDDQDFGLESEEREEEAGVRMGIGWIGGREMGRDKTFPSCPLPSLTLAK
jgi:hypothetical protein